MKVLNLLTGIYIFFNQTGFNFYDKTVYGGENDLEILTHWVYKNITPSNPTTNYKIKNMKNLIINLIT